MFHLKNYNINLATFFSLEDRKLSIDKAYTEGIYADTPANRKLGRVGMSYAEWEAKQGNREEKIDNISVYRLGKKLKEGNIIPMTLKDHKDYFLISLDDNDFKEKKEKTKEILEKLGAKVYISDNTNFIKAFKKDVVLEDKNQDIYKLGNFKFNVNSKILIDKEGKEQKLTPKETELLSLFCSHPNEFISKNSILDKIWGESNYYNSRSMDVFITNLRNKLKGDKDVEIITLPWRGFKLKLPKHKSETTFTEQDNLKEIIDKTDILKRITGKKLDAVIKYSNSVEGVSGIEVKEGATDKEKREVIADFYIDSANLEGNNKEIADNLDTIIEDALSDYTPEKKEQKNEVKEESKKEKYYLNPNLSKKINNYFGFDDEEGEWFADTPVSLIMNDDSEFGKLIEEFTDFDILSQKGKYQNNGGRNNMKNCYIEYEIIPKNTLDEDVESQKRKITIDFDTTIRDIFEKINK